MPALISASRAARTPRSRGVIAGGAERERDQVVDVRDGELLQLRRRGRGGIEQEVAIARKHRQPVGVARNGTGDAILTSGTSALMDVSGLSS